MKSKIIGPTKIARPQVYVLFFGIATHQFFWLGVAYFLEEAIKKAQKELLKEHNVQKETLGMPIFYLSRSLESLVTEITETKSDEKEKPPQNKNELMQKIVANNDKELFKQHLKDFTPQEKKLIKELLNP